MGLLEFKAVEQLGGSSRTMSVEERAVLFRVLVVEGDSTSSLDDELMVRGTTVAAVPRTGVIKSSGHDNR